MTKTITVTFASIFIPFILAGQIKTGAALRNADCGICTTELSYADTLLEYIPGCPLADPDPTGALGPCDYDGATVDGPEFVFLGQGGVLKLGFTDNLLTNSGDEKKDLWIFEVGPGVEPCFIALRPFDSYTLAQLQSLGIPHLAGDGYFEMGSIPGSTSGIDIDEIMPGYPSGSLKFDAVKITDKNDDFCWGGTPGADIDAVCALRFNSLNSSDSLTVQPELIVFPNPFLSKTRLEISEGGGVKWTCRVFDVRGVMVRSEVFIEALDLDLKELAAGMYTLSIRSDLAVFYQKVIKAE